MGTKIVIPNADFSANAIYKESSIVPIPVELVSGYCSTSSNTTVYIGALGTRVRTNELHGKFHVKTKTGFAIRAIVYYDSSIGTPPFSAGGHNNTNVVNASDVQGTTEYTLNLDKYAIITFCKSNPNESISPSDDIVDELYYIV